MDYEYIIIDGDSEDGSIEILEQYSDKIEYWISEPDSGIYNAMNKGIKRATGEYCLFLNSGDWLYNNDVLQSVISLNLIEDIIYGQQLVFQDGHYKLSAFLEPNYITLRSFINSTLPHQCTFIKRSLFDIIGLYNEDNTIVSDWEFNLLALFKFNSTLRKIDIPIAVFDQSGISSNQAMMDIHVKEKINALDTHFPRIYPDYQYSSKISDKYFRIPKIIRKFYSLII